MKKVLLLLGIAAITSSAYANPVSLQQAKNVATNFMSGKMSNVSLNLTKSYVAKTADAQTSIYIFDINNGNGFIIVSGDDAVTPILAYSTENSMPAQITNKEVSYWLDGYNQQISTVILNHTIASPKIAAKWTELSTAATGNIAAKPTLVAPLMFTKWDQMNPNGNNNDNTLYNNSCPTATPTGCVATAMAQIMKYWQNPTVGTGSHSYTATIGGALTANFGATTYNWANMPNQLTNGSTSTQKSAIAQLMLHCGISVEMVYNYAYNGGSGAQVINYYNQFAGAAAQKALPTYFGYKSTIKGVMRQFYSETQWTSMLKFEIDNSRPVLVAGFEATGGGHAFDFDGYDDNGMFDVNWGWSGIGNGYYTVDNLAPVVYGVGGGNGVFNDGQQALVMIEPASSTAPVNPYATPDFPTMNLALASTINQSHDTIVYNTAYNVTAQIKNVGTDTMEDGKLYLIATDNSNANNVFTLSSKNAVINPGASNTFTFNTTGSTVLVPGVYTLKYKYIAENFIDTTKMLVGNGVATNSITLVVKSATPTGISNAALNGAELNIYPNPARNFVTLDWNGFAGKVNSIAVFNVIGQRVASFENVTGSKFNVPVSQLSAGTYTIQMITELGSVSKKIVVGNEVK